MNASTLQTPGEYPHIVDYLRAAWGRRHFAFHLARSQVETQYSNERLGRLWLIIDPIMMVAIYGVVFGVGLRGGRDVPNFVLWLLTGQVTFRFLHRMVGSGSTALLTNQPLIGSYAFPRIVILMAEDLRAFLLFLPSLGLVMVTALLFRQWPSLRWLALPVVIVFAVAMCLGAGGILARISFRFPDVAQLVDVAFRFLFFGSFVFFPAEMMVERGGEAGQILYDLLPIFNPLYAFVCIMRWIILDNGGDQLGRAIVSALVWSLTTGLIGTYVFYRGELTYSAARIYRQKANKMAQR